MKNSFCKIIAVVLSLLLLTACAGGESRESQTTESPKHQVTESPDVRLTESPDIQATESPDLQSTKSPDLQMTESLPAVEKVLNSDVIVWRYVDDPVRLAKIDNMDWTLPGYDDSDWAVGIGSFGAEDGKLDEISDGFTPYVCLRQYLPDGKNIPVYYFRLAFLVENIGDTEPYNLNVIYDDAVIVYLNGEPVFQGNVPEGGYGGPNEYGCAEAVQRLAPVTFTLDSSLFQKGKNVLAVELHQSSVHSGDIYFELQSAAVLQNKSLSLGVGANDTEMLVTWQGGGTDGYVEVAPVKETEGELFAETTVYQAQTVYTNDWGANTFRTVLTSLKPGQEYAYRVTDEETSLTHIFTVPDGGEVYSFIVHGDPQISKKGDGMAIAIYEDIIKKTMDGQKPDLILSLGDQSDSADDPELFLRYLSAEPLKEVPLAVVTGNHESGSDIFSRLFFVPNVDEDTSSSAGDMDGDYWFYRNHTLFLCLNSNNKDFESHRRFLNEAKEACLAWYGQPDWTIAVLHHSLFSAGRHAADEGILERREAFAPMLKEVEVDVVFSGHDHTYTRSFPMDGLEPLNDGDDGIVYFSLGSPTGTKHYDLYEEEMDYAAVADGSRWPSVTRVDVTKTAMTVTTFIRKTDGSLNVLDSYEIVK